ncbi:MAG: hypothetical protein ABSE48_08925 [Verrucomicrobiota bacterium]
MFFVHDFPHDLPQLILLVCVVYLLIKVQNNVGLVESTGERSRVAIATAALNQHWQKRSQTIASKAQLSGFSGLLSTNPALITGLNEKSKRSLYLTFLSTFANFPFEDSNIGNTLEKI